MRIIAWNCQGAFHRKAAPLFALRPDIAVVSECLQEASQSLAGYSSLWYGDAGKKGVAIFYKSSWRVSQISAPSHKWLVPLAVIGPENFTLVAVWACPAKTGVSSYIKLLHEAISTNGAWFGAEPVVMAGDFNSNSRWDKAAEFSHASFVSKLADNGMISAYHFLNEKAHGQECEWTFFAGRKREKYYHLDYIFIPTDWRPRIQGLEIGRYDDWTRYSDHSPLWLDLIAKSS